MTPDELERITDRQLRALPVPHAPHTLLPRVMEAVRILAGKPWYARTWFTWPLAGQMLSAGVVLSIVVGFWFVSPSLQAFMDGVVARASAGLLAPFAGVIDHAHRALVATRIVWQAGQSIVSVLLVPVLLMFATCATFATALERVALGGASRS